MRQDSENPSGNTLPAGFPEAEVISAIAASGYPLQGQIARKLQGEFRVTEEWGYFDNWTNTHRSLDLFAYRQHHCVSGDIHPSCVLLIECKRSEYPYVFFRRMADYGIPGFPHVLGSNDIQMRSQRLSKDVSVASVLGLGELPFSSPGPPLSAGFSKLMRKGKKFELSGSEPFHSIVLPLSRSLDHASALYKPLSKPTRLTPTLTLCICVLDTAMIFVDDPDNLTDPLLAPWWSIHALCNRCCSCELL